MAEGSEEWRLSTADFARLWNAQDGLEFPTEFVQPEWDAQAADTPSQEGGRAALGAEQRRALAAFTRPRCSITVRGINAARDFADPAHHLRMLAAWSGPEYAYLARQSPADAIDTPGTIAITRHPIGQIARAVIERLPPATGPGRLRTDSDVVFTRRPLAGDITIDDVVPDDAFYSAAHAFSSDVSVGACGSIVIRVGSITDGCQPTTIDTRYRDVVGDGRYFLVLDRPGVAVAADGDYMIRLFNRILNLARSRHDARFTEREGPNY